MAVLDEDFCTDLPTTEGGDTLWSLPIVAPVCEPLDWASLLEEAEARVKEERGRANVAELRCEELRRTEREARSLANSLTRRLDTCRFKLKTAVPKTASRVTKALERRVESQDDEVADLRLSLRRSHEHREQIEERHRDEINWLKQDIDRGRSEIVKVFDTTPYGISVWVCMLYERFVCCRPLHRVAAWLADMGLAISPGTLADSIKRFVPLFEPLAEEILAHQNEAALRHADETSWRVQAYREKGRSSRAWLWTSVSPDAVYFHIDPSRSAEVAMRLFGSTKGTVVLVCDRLSTYKKLARELAGKVILQWCWAHQRRSFIDCAAARVRLRRWCQRWIERIAEIYRLNDARLKHYDRAHPLERQSSAFDVAHARLKKAVDELFAAAEAELAGLTDRARRAKPLRSLVKHREGLCVFVDKPFVPMDNNRGELALRSAVIGRRLSFGSDSEKGAGFTATMYSVAGTLAINGIDVRRWLKEWLTACAENGGEPPDDLSPWLPWSMSEERRRELTASG